MKENNQKDNKELRFVDLFAGAGGFSLGFEMAGYDLMLALEKDDWAIETLHANHKSDKILHADITTAHDIKRLLICQPNVIIGGPPCQGFSNAAQNVDPNDPRNSLFIYFSKWVETFRPTIFVMENVKGILTKKNSAGERISTIINKTFENLGYQMDTWVLQAAEYGVPQNRKRVFIVGNLMGLHIPPPQVTHYLPDTSIRNKELKPAICTGDAILDLPYISAGEGQELLSYDSIPTNGYQFWARDKSQYVYNHIAMAHTSRLIERFKLIQEGSDIEEIPLHFKVRQRNGNGTISSRKFNSNYRHLKTDRISNTIPASFYSSFIHPIIPRNITSREAARIQSFPDSYIFKGKRTLISKKLLQKQGKDYFDKLSQYNQIGNAVPPLLAKAIGLHIKNYM